MEIPIEDILKKYSVAAPERAVRKELRVVIKEVTGVEVPLSAVSYQKGRVRVDTSPLERLQIHIHKEAILEKIKDRIKTKKITDVR